MKTNKRLAIALILIAMCMVLMGADGDQSSTLTSRVNRRNQEPYVKPVWEYVITGVFDTDDTTNVTESIPFNGILMKVILVAPNGTNAVTYQVQIKDNADIVIFDTGEKAEAVTYTYNLFEPVSGTIDIVYGPSGAIGATNPDILIYLRGI
jgi:hypothetical protein